jgi:hypothetical protein
MLGAPVKRYLFGSNPDTATLGKYGRRSATLVASQGQGNAWGFESSAFRWIVLFRFDSGLSASWCNGSTT